MIFLTGMPRCGSTWAAQALARLSGSRYVHEPLNGHRHPEWAAYNMRYFRRGACDRTMMRALRSSVSPPGEKPWWRRVLDRADPVVLKEVHATLAVECIARHLRPRVVIMSRHPCGVAASWKSLGWLSAPWADGDPLLAQQALVEDHLAPYADHILSSQQPFFRVGAYWGAIYHVLRRLAARHPRWQWITHEQLCDAPQARFAALLHHMRVPVDPSAWTFLEQHNRPRTAQEGPYDTFREAESEAEKWQRLLTAAEAQQVMAGAEPFDVPALLGLRAGMPGPGT